MRDKQVSCVPVEGPVLPRNASARSLNRVRGIDGAFSELPTSDADSSELPVRMAISRQSSSVRFSSRPVPETRITIQGTAGPTIMFADASPDIPAPERPSHTRASSAGRLPGRSPAESRATIGETKGQPSVRPAEAGPRSLQDDAAIPNMASTDGGADAYLNVPDTHKPPRRFTALVEEDESASYSAQGFELSFNDLPTRAQHLVLNELMRQNSSETAVLFTTVPIPAEGTCEDEPASVQYLSDVEMLCNELPPVLLVLSNNMTVTVGL